MFIAKQQALLNLQSHQEHHFTISTHLCPQLQSTKSQSFFLTRISSIMPYSLASSAVIQ